MQDPGCGKQREPRRKDDRRPLDATAQEKLAGQYPQPEEKIESRKEKIERISDVEARQDQSCFAGPTRNAERIVDGCVSPPHPNEGTIKKIAVETI